MGHLIDRVVENKVAHRYEFTVATQIITFTKKWIFPKLLRVKKSGIEKANQQIKRYMGIIAGNGIMNEMKFVVIFRFASIGNKGVKPISLKTLYK